MKVRMLIGMVLSLAISMCLLGGIAQAKAEPSHAEILEQAGQAFARSDFPKTLELVEPLVEQLPASRESYRLKILSLVRLQKTKEGVEVFDQFIKTTGKDDEALLREMAIQSILPFRSDMREQVRGSAYSALKEMQRYIIFSVCVWLSFLW